MSDLTVRVDADADYRDVLAAVAAFNREAGRPVLWCGGRRLVIAATVHDGDELVGAAGLHRATWRGRHVLVWIWTHPEHRRRGVATALLEGVQAHLGRPVWHQEPATADGHAWQSSIAGRLERVWGLGYDEALHPDFAPYTRGKRPRPRPFGAHMDRLGLTPDRLVQLAQAHTLLGYLIDEHETTGRTVELIRHWHTGSDTPQDRVDLRRWLMPMLAFTWEYLQAAPEDRIGADAWRELFGVVGFTHCDHVDFGRPAERPTEPVTLYRGAIPERASGWMWTDDLDEARCYATRNGMYRGDVWTTTAPPDHLMATLDLPGNARQYVIDPRGLSIAHLEALLPDAPCARGPHFPAVGRDGLLTAERLDAWARYLRDQPAPELGEPFSGPTQLWGIDPSHCE